MFDKEGIQRLDSGLVMDMRVEGFGFRDLLIRPHGFRVLKKYRHARGSACARICWLHKNYI